MNEKQTKFFSFLGGLIFVSVVTGVLISRNEKIRNEIENQTMSLLNTSKNIIQQIQYVVGKLGKITNEINSDKSSSTIEGENTNFLPDSYDVQWVTVESQSHDYVKSLLSR